MFTQRYPCRALHAIERAASKEIPLLKKELLLELLGICVLHWSPTTQPWCIERFPIEWRTALNENGEIGSSFWTITTKQWKQQQSAVDRTQFSEQSFKYFGNGAIHYEWKKLQKKQFQLKNYMHCWNAFVVHFFALLALSFVIVVIHSFEHTPRFGAFRTQKPQANLCSILRFFYRIAWIWRSGAMQHFGNCKKRANVDQLVENRLWVQINQNCCVFLFSRLAWFFCVNQHQRAAIFFFPSTSFCGLWLPLQLQRCLCFLQIEMYMYSFLPALRVCTCDAFVTHVAWVNVTALTKSRMRRPRAVSGICLFLRLWDRSASHARIAINIGCLIATPPSTCRTRRSSLSSLPLSAFANRPGTTHHHVCPFARIPFGRSLHSRWRVIWLRIPLHAGVCTHLFFSLDNQFLKRNKLHMHMHKHAGLATQSMVSFPKGMVHVWCVRKYSG